MEFKQLDFSELTSEQKSKIEFVQYDYTDIPFGEEFLDIRVEQARQIAACDDSSKQNIFKNLYGRLQKVTDNLPENIKNVLKNIEVQKDIRGVYCNFQLLDDNYNIIYKFARNQTVDFECKLTNFKIKLSNSLNMYGDEGWSIAFLSKQLNFCISKLPRTDGQKGYEMKVTSFDNNFYYCDNPCKYNSDLSKCMDI